MELPIIVWILLFLVSFALIYYFADYLIDLIEDLSEGYSISPIILGVFILGIDLEESIVSLFAAKESLPYLSIGNLIGNSIFAIVIAFAIPPLLYKINILNQLPKFYYLSLLLAVSSILLSTIFPNYLWFFALLNLLVFIYYVVRSINIQRKYEVSENKDECDDDDTGVKLIVKVIIAILIVFFAGQLLVTSAEQLLIMSNLSETFFGLVITALITNVEEFWLMVKSIQKGKIEIGISAQIGKLLWNTTLIFGISGIIISGYVISSIMVISSVFLVVISAILIFNLLRNDFSKRNSMIYLFIMIIYFIMNIIYI